MTYPLLQRLRWFVDGGLAFLLALLPFEIVQGIQLPGLVLTNVELAALAVLAAWAALLALERRRPRIDARLALALGGFLALLLLSALLAESDRGESLKWTLRQWQGGLLALCLADRIAANGWRLGQRLLIAMGLGGLLSAGLGLAELAAPSAIGWLLGPFRRTTTLMGGILRLSGSFHHANIAAMYFEALLPLLAAGALALLPRRWRWIGAAGAAALWLAILLTYSRASVFTAGALLLGVAGAVWALIALRRMTGVLLGPRRGRSQEGGGANPSLVKRQAWQSLGLAASLLGGLGLMLALNPPLRLRLSATQLDAWYNASYDPAPIEAMAPNEIRRVPIAVTNTGQAPWYVDGPRPMKLAYHWLDPASGIVVDFEGERTELPQAVQPGASVELDAQVRAPLKPGEYLLAWDMVGEEVSWFSQLGVKPAQVAVEVSPTAVAAAPTPGARPRPSKAPAASGKLEASQPAPDRSTLWRAAITLWRRHPILGIGPGVFQHAHGALTGIADSDARYHTHNMYLEILTGGGLIGLLAFGVLLGMLVLRGLRRLAGERDERRWWWLLAALGGLLAFQIHGMLDMFLGFTPTYLLFWTWIGMIGGLTNPETPT